MSGDTHLNPFHALLMLEIAENGQRLERIRTAMQGIRDGKQVAYKVLDNGAIELEVTDTPIEN